MYRISNCLIGELPNTYGTLNPDTLHTCRRYFLFFRFRRPAGERTGRAAATSHSHPDTAGSDNIYSPTLLREGSAFNPSTSYSVKNCGNGQEQKPGGVKLGSRPPGDGGESRLRDDRGESRLRDDGGESWLRDDGGESRMRDDGGESRLRRDGGESRLRGDGGESRLGGDSFEMLKWRHNDDSQFLAQESEEESLSTVEFRHMGVI